jgi:raffinose/stachyose/melibiose transport system permease protein
MRATQRPKGLLLAAFLLLLMAISLFPVLLMLLNSVKTDVAVMTNPLAIPDHLAWDNFPKAWGQAHLGDSLFLSLRIAFLTVIFTCTSSSLAAYALARRKMRGWSLASGYFLMAATVPISLLIFPLYGLVVRLGLLGNEVVLALIYTAIYTPFSIFLLRSYFLSVPLELEEAAQLDGAAGTQIFWRVVLPLVTPGILTVALLVALFTWNEFLLSLTFFQSQDVKTAIVQFYSFEGRYGTQWSLLMASAVILAGPIIVLFLIFQRLFVDGLVAGSIKG